MRKRRGRLGISNWDYDHNLPLLFPDSIILVLSYSFPSLLRIYKGNREFFVLSNECSFPSVSDRCKIGTKSRARTTKRQKRVVKESLPGFLTCTAKCQVTTKGVNFLENAKRIVPRFPQFIFPEKGQKGQNGLFSIAAFLCQYVCVCGSPSHAERRRREEKGLGGMRRKRRGRRGNGWSSGRLPPPFPAQKRRGKSW